jgi:hypothetical protein
MQQAIAEVVSVSVSKEASKRYGGGEERRTTEEALASRTFHMRQVPSKDDERRALGMVEEKSKYDTAAVWPFRMHCSDDR